VGAGYGVFRPVHRNATAVKPFFFSGQFFEILFSRSLPSHVVCPRIPIIDLGRRLLGRGRRPGRRSRAQGREIRGACPRRIGFFYIVNHGRAARKKRSIDCRGQQAAGRKFFAFPLG